MTDPRPDVVVVGSGAAGLAAGIEAMERGLRVTLVEANHTYGGAARLSGGGCLIAGSPLQEQLGIADSPEVALDDWIAVGGPSADVPWARRYVRASVTEVFDWAARHGVPWEGVRLEWGNTSPRWHYPTGGGPGLIDPLYAEARRLGVDWRPSSEVTTILLEDGRCTGVEVEGPGGRTAIRAGAVILASGGFANAPDLIEANLPPGTASLYLRGGSPTATGTVHRMLRGLGADLVEMDAFVAYPIGTPSPRDPSGARGVSVVGISNIWVNAHGRRFHNELRRGMAAVPFLLRQPGARSWGIFDSGELPRIVLGGDPYYKAGYEPDADIPARVREFVGSSRALVSAPTLERLAAAAGLPQDALVETVQRFNAAIASGAEREPEFGRPLRDARPIENAPFYAIRYRPWIQKCLGGARTDDSCRLLRVDGSAVSGLYAAGEVAGMAGGHMNGRGTLEGTTLGPSLFAGRIAAAAAASEMAASAAA